MSGLLLMWHLLQKLQGRRMPGLLPLQELLRVLPLPQLLPPQLALETGDFVQALRLGLRAQRLLLVLQLQQRLLGLRVPRCLLVLQQQQLLLGLLVQHLVLVSQLQHLPQEVLQVRQRSGRRWLP